MTKSIGSVCENTSPSLSLSGTLSPRECDDYARGRLTFARSVLLRREVKELTPCREGSGGRGFEGLCVFCKRGVSAFS